MQALNIIPRMYSEERENEIVDRLAQIEKALTDSTAVIHDLHSTDETWGESEILRSAEHRERINVLRDERRDLMEEQAGMRMTKESTADPAGRRRAEPILGILRKRAGLAGGEEMTSDETALMSKWMNDLNMGFDPHRGQFMVPFNATQWAPDVDTIAGRFTQDTVVQAVRDSLKDYGDVFSCIQIIHTPHGNKITWPVIDDSASISPAPNAALNTTQTEQTLPVPTTVDIESYTFPTGFILVSRELFEDVAWVASDYIRAIMLRRIGRRLEQVVTRGNSGPNITGIESLPQEYTTSTSKTIKWEDLVRAMYKINRAYRRNGGESGMHGFSRTVGKVGWMMPDIMLPYLMNLADTQNRPLILPSLTMPGEFDMLLNYPIFVNESMSTASGETNSGVYESGSDLNKARASASPIIFGDWSYLVGRFSGAGLTIEEHYDSSLAKDNVNMYIGRVRFDFQAVIKAVSGTTIPNLVKVTVKA